MTQDDIVSVLSCTKGEEKKMEENKAFFTVGDDAYAPFVHLHNHTDYSLLDGAGSIRKYIAK